MRCVVGPVVAAVALLSWGVAAAQSAGDAETELRLGRSAMDGRHYRAAARLFRAALVQRPEAAPIRFELGRALFLSRDYDGAERQLRFARAGKISAAMMADIDRYLDAIRQARALGSDIAAGPTPQASLDIGRTIPVVDVPVTPLQPARGQSALGLSLDVAGEWSPSVGQDLNLRLGGQLQTADYRTTDFDDTIVATYAGLRFTSGRWEVSPLATYYRRWYEGSFYNQGSGASLETTFFATPKLALDAVVTAQYVDYGPPAGQNGLAVSTTFGAVYTLSSASFVSGSAGVVRQWAALDPYANTALQFQLGYTHDLPAGFAFSFQPSYVLAHYDAPAPGYAVARLDHQWDLQLTLQNHRFKIAGFTPRVLYAYTRDSSTIALYAYQRNRFEIGLTRVF